MSGVQQRIHHLIELAARGQEDDHEARSAALQACRLIRQHGLIVVTPEELVTIVAAPAPRTHVPPPPPTTRAPRSAPAPRAGPSAAAAPPPAPSQLDPPGAPQQGPWWQRPVPTEVVDAVGNVAGRIVSGAIRDMLRGR